MFSAAVRGYRRTRGPMDESRLDAMREAMASMSLRGVSREFLSRVCGRGYEMDDDEGANKSARLSEHANQHSASRLHESPFI